MIAAPPSLGTDQDSDTWPLPAVAVSVGAPGAVGAGGGPAGPMNVSYSRRLGEPFPALERWFIVAFDASALATIAGLATGLADR